MVNKKGPAFKKQDLTIKIDKNNSYAFTLPFTLAITSSAIPLGAGV